RQETFVFPFSPDSASIHSFKRYLEAKQLHEADWEPVVMTTQKALAMTPPAFQSIVNKGSPVVLVGQPEPIAFDLSALFGLMDFRSEVRCICSDDVSSTGDQQLLVMRAGDAAQEMCDWQNSRPLIIAHASTAATEYQPIESSHDSGFSIPTMQRLWISVWKIAHFVFRIGEGRLSQLWVLYTPPTSHPTALALVFTALVDTSFSSSLSYEMTNKSSSISRMWTYLSLWASNICMKLHIVSPHSFFPLAKQWCPFDDFIFSIFPPGQIYAYATLSRRVDDDGEVSPGSIMQASYFLAAGCMKRSFFASWLDRSSADQSASEDAWSSTVTTCLMAMVLKAVRALSTPEGQIPHSPNVVNLFALASMAMMFVGEHEPNLTAMAKALCRHCQDQEPDECSKLLDEFHDLRIANHAYKVADLDDTVRKDFDTKASCFRQSMMEAVEKIHPFPRDTQE
ncbi:uncharacterized protein EI90DRAFT_3235370, partial [Cantharellus anzutake]|uniref:uncharacterized protein n=1 Tax=Cantharellus anzutake TaxID=1750568 RepID=UPI001904DEF7